jgi:hypothetical protein
MTTLTERTVLQSIRVLAGGRIEVERVEQILRGDEVIHSRPILPPQVLEPGKDVPGADLEPEVLAVVAAAWTPQQLEASIASMRERICTAQAAADAALTDVKRTRDAVDAAHAELNAEQQTLAERAELVSTERSSLFAQHEAIRKQRPQLDSMLNDLAAAVAAPGDDARPSPQL